MLFRSFPIDFNNDRPVESSEGGFQRGITFEYHEVRNRHERINRAGNRGRGKTRETEESIGTKMH